MKDCGRSRSCCEASTMELEEEVAKLREEKEELQKQNFAAGRNNGNSEKSGHGDAEHATWIKESMLANNTDRSMVK
ncbi:hypothetical protein V6N13_048100 [Hibiscus sabdariffa]